MMQDWSVFIKEHFSKDVPYIQFMDISVLETARGYARVSLTAKPEHGNTYGIVHGGICASLVDVVVGITLRTLKNKIVTIETTTNYYEPAQIGDTLYATGTLIKEGKKILYGNAEITNQDGRHIAGGRGTFFILGEDDGLYK